MIGGVQSRREFLGGSDKHKGKLTESLLKETWLFLFIMQSKGENREESPKKYSEKTLIMRIGDIGKVSPESWGESRVAPSQLEDRGVDEGGHFRFQNLIGGGKHSEMRGTGELRMLLFLMKNPEPPVTLMKVSLKTYPSRSKSRGTRKRTADEIRKNGRIKPWEIKGGGRGGKRFGIERVLG